MSVQLPIHAVKTHIIDLAKKDLHIVKDAVDTANRLLKKIENYNNKIEILEKKNPTDWEIKNEGKLIRRVTLAAILGPVAVAAFVVAIAAPFFFPSLGIGLLLTAGLFALAVAIASFAGSFIFAEKAYKAYQGCDHKQVLSNEKKLYREAFKDLKKCNLEKEKEKLQAWIVTLNQYKMSLSDIEINRYDSYYRVNGETVLEDLDSLIKKQIIAKCLLPAEPS